MLARPLVRHATRLLVRLKRFAPTDIRYSLVGLSLLLAVLVWGSLDTLLPRWLYGLEERSGDWVWRATAKTSDERRLIIVDIDERSLAGSKSTRPPSRLTTVGIATSGRS